MNGSCTYFELPGVSSHMLIDMQRSPLHCWARYLDPNRASDTPTAAQQLGTLVHLLTLTPEAFSDECVLAPTINRRTQAGKADYAALASEGKQVISMQDYQAAMRMRKAIYDHPIARGLFQNGEPETVITVSRDTELLPLKGRLDWLGQAPGIVELKTASDARKDYFLRDVYRYHYHLSAAYYRMLVSKHTGTPAPDIPHTFVVVEPKPPYAVAVYHTAETLLAEGRQLWETQLARFDDCWMMKTWPGYPVDVLERVGRPGGKSGSLRFEIEEGELEL
ncbi:MAG: PD-(D/E)XK nuclease-like domain-containing protein [Candidatus Competibacter denitrificans]|jgi:hypothetical protein